MKPAYYKLHASNIVEDIAKNESVYNVVVEGVKMKIHPHVYPSEKFRTTAFVLKSIQDKFSGKCVCDMGCGPGIVGLYALSNGASHVVQADVNQFAVTNARENVSLNKFNSDKVDVVESDCFDSVPRQVFDIIIWNMPYHNDPIEIVDPLERAFYDPELSSIRKFLRQVPDYSTENTEIYIAFSNKGDVEGLEKIFEACGFLWSLWRITNTDQDYDNRIYSLSYS